MSKMTPTTQPIEIVAETARAYQVQIWTGCSSDPDESARCYWIPKTQCETEERNERKFVTSAARWWVAQNRLWGVL